MSLVGFKKAEIRVLDGGQGTLDTNIFVIEGKSGKGATQTANVTGLSSEPVKSYGSDVAYYSSSKGVGDVKVELGMLDVPFDVQNAILGRKSKSNLTTIGAGTVAPMCSLTLYSANTEGKEVALGFFKGQFSMESIELETLNGDQKELATETLTFTALASDSEEHSGEYVAIGVGTEGVTAMKTAMKTTPGV